MTFQHLVIGAAVWVALSIPAAFIVARVIRARDEHEAAQRRREDANGRDEGRHLRVVV